MDSTQIFADFEKEKSKGFSCFSQFLPADNFYFYLMNENEISYLVRGCIFKTYNEPGPGLLESVYQVVLEYEIRKSGLEVKTQVELPVFYEGLKLEVGYRLDLLIEDKVIVEIKSVKKLAEVHHKQLLTYLRLSNKKLGLLVNFSTDNIAASIFRKANHL